jgi:transcriptional regulator with XRE-family HTH domain
MTRKGTKQTNIRSSAPADKVLGLKIRAARNDAKMSQEDLGTALGVSFQQVQKYEKGTNRVASSRLVEIAKHLQKPLSYFLDEAKYKPNSRGEKLAEMAASREGHMVLEAMVDMNPDMRAQVISVARALARQAEAA